MANNSKLTAKAGTWRLLSLTGYKASGKPQRRYGEFPYKARIWHQQRRMIVKAEYNHMGDNTRYVVTSLTDSPQRIYDGLYLRARKHGELHQRTEIAVL